MEHVRTKADQLALEQGCYFDEREANKIIRFAETLFKPGLQLLPWQKRFLRQLTGWKTKDHNRRFRFANLHIAKKNGKTLLIAIICAYELLFCKDPGERQVVSVAASKENAGQIFRALKPCFANLKKAEPTIQIADRKEYKQILIPSLEAEFLCLASDGSRQHGHNLNCIAIDEGHVTPDSVYKALRYAHDAKPNGLLCVISTAGDDVSHWYHAVYSKSKRILSGEDLDTQTYAEVWESDSTADPEDPQQWYKANPSLGFTFSEEQFRQTLLADKSKPGDWLNFQKLKLNRWVKPTENAYLDVSDWDKWKRNIPEDQLKKYDAVIGVDLSETTDPSSVSILWKLDNHCYHIRSFAFVCAQGVKNREPSNLPLYQQFVSQGSMSITEGNMIDDKLIEGKILDLCEAYNVVAINFDPAGGWVMMNNIRAAGWNAQRLPQGFAEFNPPMREFSKAYREGRITHDGGDWLRYCFSNVCLESNRHGDIRPNKTHSRDHIDGAVSVLIGFATAMEIPETIREGITWL